MGNRYTQPHHTSSTSAENAKQFIPHPSMPHHAPAGFLTWISQIFHTSSGPQARYVGAPPPHSAPQPRVFIPKAYFVPLNAFQSLDLVSVPQTPEMEVKHALLSEHPEKKVISLTGAVGTGKTNILCALGRDQDIMNAFSDGVWFFHLRCDVNHSTEEGFQFFLNQMNLFVAKISRDLSADFQDIPETTRLAQTPSTCIDKLMPSLMTKKVVLLFDDLSRDNEIVYDMVRHMASAVLFNPNSSLKILVSTRNSEFAQVQPNISSVQINPQVYTAERNRRILCSSAGLPNCDITSLSDPSRKALNQIVEKCGGLALALRIAGYGVGRMMGRSVEVSMENAFVQYWEKLEIDSSVLWRGPSVDGHEGLSKGIESGLGSLQKTWTREEISVEEMFTSFCVVQKKEEYVPLGVIMKLWNVNKAIALEGMEMFEENGVAILVRENRGIVGIKIADLMRELSVDMARRRESGMWWHTRIIDGYRASTNRRRSGGGSVDDRANESRNERSRWVNLDKNDKYIIDNIVWHLLGAGHENEVLRLVTEYTWIEKMNQDEQRPAFEKIGSEFEMLREHLKRQGKTETDRRVKVEIEAVLETIGACAEYRYENRKECTFQLYGRLCCVEPASSLVKRIIWSIERDAECPWARAGPGVQMNEASSELKNVLQLGEDALCVSAGAVEEEVIVGGRNGKLKVLKKCDGSVKKSLNGHDKEHDIVCVSVDKKSREVYSCTSKGSVIIWNEYRREQEFEVGQLREEEWITCMGILPQARHVFFGTSEGRLLIMNANGDTRDRSQVRSEPKPEVPRISQGIDDIYDVFISHAGVDKATIAELLYDFLVAMKLRVFLDKAELQPGQEASEEMKNAMRKAKIAVVILSPEFATRKWTLIELNCFLERYSKYGESGMIVIPVFYRMTVDDCSRPEPFFEMKSEKGINVFVDEKFLSRTVEATENETKKVFTSLNRAKRFTGIENTSKVTNMRGRVHKARRSKFVEKIACDIARANRRLSNGESPVVITSQYS